MLQNFSVTQILDKKRSNFTSVNSTKLYKINLRFDILSKLFWFCTKTKVTKMKTFHEIEASATSYNEKVAQ